MGQNSFSSHIFSKFFFILSYHFVFFHSRSRSQVFLGMIASDSLSRTMGMDFFIPFPFPNFGNAFFSFPSPSQIMGMLFFHSLPLPKLWEWIFFIPFPFPNCGNRFFPFPSRSRTSGMELSIPVPVPKLPNVILLTPDFETTLGAHGDFFVSNGGACLCSVGSIWQPLSTIRLQGIESKSPVHTRRECAHVHQAEFPQCPHHRDHFHQC